MVIRAAGRHAQCSRLQQECAHIGFAGPEKIPADEVLGLEENEAVRKSSQGGLLVPQDGFLDGRCIMQALEGVLLLHVHRALGFKNAPLRRRVFLMYSISMYAMVATETAEHMERADEFGVRVTQASQRCV